MGERRAAESESQTASVAQQPTRLARRQAKTCERLLADIQESKDDDPAWMNWAMPWAFARMWLAFRAAAERPQRVLHPTIAHARSLIHDEPDVWGRDDLARECGLSSAHFSRLFTEQVGMPLTDYRNQLRLAAALDLLRDTTDDVLTVALRAGFGSYPQFHRIFVKELGTTPAAWRRRQ